MPGKPVPPIPEALVPRVSEPKPTTEPAFSEEQLAKMEPWEREYAEALMQRFPTLTAEKILAAIKAA